MKLAVTSPSFSKHPQLIEQVSLNFSKAKLNTEGIRLKDEALFNYVKDSEALIIGLENFDQKLLERLPKLKVIAKYGVGLDNVDLEYCKNHNIHIAWKGGVNRLSVAELALGFMLALGHNFYQSSNLLKQGTWKKDGGFQLSNKVVGIIGVGHVGKELIRLLKPFQCKVLVNDIIEQEDYYNKNKLIVASKEEIYQNADIISLHTPLNGDTFEMINQQSMELMSDQTILINTARGNLINLDSLENALFENKILGAAIDVYDQEPPKRSRLLSHPNLINTPHIAGNAKEAVLAMGTQAILGLKDFYES
ncbi:MAG: phosphoglycerate dehydrogenase [Candidatus Cloacimonetes bacterium]|nr:phosphoglycerate dehydrogenase [Candidatus Cloacimonadota bacterium]